MFLLGLELNYFLLVKYDCDKNNSALEFHKMLIFQSMFHVKPYQKLYLNVGSFLSSKILHTKLTTS